MTSVSRIFLLIVCTVSLYFPGGDGRKSLTPPQEIKVERIAEGPPCTLNVNKDLVEPQPLFLQPGSTEFWRVNNQGQLEIPRGVDIELHCTQGFQISPKEKSFNATCLEDKTFLIKGNKLQFDKLNCTAQVKYNVRQTNATCALGAELYEVGFNVAVNRFIKTLRICHDKSAVATLWSYNKLDPAVDHFQKSVQRVNFSKAGYFGKRNMNYFYSKENQREVFQNLIGRNYERFFNNRTQFLSRGHLSAKTDHIFGTQQRATFNFFNAAPQWQIVNGGIWNAVENGIRKIVASKGLEMECLTGTWGVMSLPNEKGEPRDVYLAFDANNNGEIPVPKLFYKMIVEPRSLKGVVLIGVNNPYLSIDEVQRDYVICEDVSASVPWIQWKRDRFTNLPNLAKGYYYACRVSDFARAVKVLPRNLEDVREILV